MATFVIGDVHGCYHTLLDLVSVLDVDPERDELWYIGDLVGRGPYGLEVLRWVRSQAPTVGLVLGNHDLHFLAVWSGAIEARRADRFEDILRAPEIDTLCDWLLTGKLVHRTGSHLLVHAGLLPEWSTAEALVCARDVEAILQADPAVRELFFRAMYGNEPAHWSVDLDATPRLRLIVNAMTRMRMLCEGGLVFEHSGPPETATPEQTPWYESPQALGRAETVVFGHWSALGLRRGKNWICIDSGCIWGRTLTALRLEDGATWSVQRHERDAAACTM